MARPHDVTTAMIGIWLVSAALIGYLYRPLPMASRVTLTAAGSCLLISIGIFASAFWTDVAGLGVVAVVIARDAIFSRGKRSSPG